MTGDQDVYFRLGERLNRYPMKMLLVEPYLAILRRFYTEEEAELGAAMPMGSRTAAELAVELGRDVEALTERLETMADKGTAFVSKEDDGVSRYALTPFVPGVVEFQLMRGTDTPRDREIARMLEDFLEGEMGDLMGEAFKDPEVVKELIPNPPARTITIEQELPPGTQIYPFEKLTELVERETSFAAAKCYCRHHAYLLDRPCRVEGVPEYSCLAFGKTADYIVDRGFGKRITKAETYAILEATEKAGLVHNTNNFLERTMFICNCCGCCCGFLKSIKRFDSNAMLAYSNFVVQADPESCAGCGDCLDRCQMEALSLVEERIRVETARCLGCGNCATVCPTGFLTMVRRSDASPPRGDDQTQPLGM